MSDDTVLELDRFGVAFGPRVVLSDVTLSLPRTGITTLVGPAGSGKSTLLRTLAGLNDAHPGLATWGEARFDRGPLVERRTNAPGEIRRGIGFVMQHARFFLASVRENLVSALPRRAWLDAATQTRLAVELLRVNGLGELVSRLEHDVVELSTAMQRRLAVVLALAAEPLLLFADEPAAGLEEDDALELLALLRMQAHFRSVLVVTHNQRFARAAGGTTVLVAGGRVLETAPARTFFDAPSTESGRRFVRTGGCAVPSPGTSPEELSSSAPPPHAPAAEVRVPQSWFAGPRGFFWLETGKLGGLPRPGIVAPLERDLEGLERLGVTVLVTLEEARTVEPESLARHGIASIHFPVTDMGVPSLEATEHLCHDVLKSLSAGHVVALHCRAGLGRTGTLLACLLVFRGECARAAVERVRRLNSACIQSRQQVDFLSAYEAFVRARGVTAASLDGP